MINSQKSAKTNIRNMVATSLMMALTVVMFLTPIGTLRLPLVSVTISHLPALITTLTLGLGAGLIVALTFGVTSLIAALTMPTGIFDPFFINPLISILPRLLIPVAAYFAYKGLTRLLPKAKPWQAASAAIAIAAGNLTNTFGVYSMLYLIYAKAILDKTGDNALGLILGAISTTTVIKCVVVMAIGTPLVMTLRLALRQRGS